MTVPVTDWADAIGNSTVRDQRDCRAKNIDVLASFMTGRPTLLADFGENNVDDSKFVRGLIDAPGIKETINFERSVTLQALIEKSVRN